MACVLCIHPERAEWQREIKDRGRHGVPKARGQGPSQSKDGTKPGVAHGHRVDEGPPAIRGVASRAMVTRRSGGTIHGRSRHLLKPTERAFGAEGKEQEEEEEERSSACGSRFVENAEKASRGVREATLKWITADQNGAGASGAPGAEGGIIAARAKACRCTSYAKWGNQAGRIWGDTPFHLQSAFTSPLPPLLHLGTTCLGARQR